MPTAHITELGFCIHDFAMSPCQRFRDCLRCTEHICVKGDRRNERLGELLNLVKQQVEKAQSARAGKDYGADRWEEVHVDTKARLEALVAILNDPSVPEGSIIRLGNEKEFSPIKRALHLGGAGAAWQDGQARRR